MKPFAAVAFAFLGATLTMSGQSAPATKAPAQVSSDAAEAQAWRDKHEVDYRRDWVSIAGLFPFKPGRNTAGSAKGTDIELPAPVPASFGVFVLNGIAVRFEP